MPYITTPLVTSITSGMLADVVAALAEQTVLARKARLANELFSLAKDINSKTPLAAVLAATRLHAIERECDDVMLEEQSLAQWKQTLDAEPEEQPSDLVGTIH